MRNTVLAKCEVYHVYNRGVDKRDIFLARRDYQRFTDGLAIFNDSRNPNGRRFSNSIDDENRKPLVNIIAYCLMPNHFHLLLEEVEDGGITRFMKKLSTGYAMYFNKKHGRTGALIQGVYKRSRIKSNDRLLEMSRYIHANPKKFLNNERELLEYPWSSLSYYLGHEQEVTIVNNAEMVLGQFKTADEYRSFVLGGT